MGTPSTPLVGEHKCQIHLTGINMSDRIQGGVQILYSSLTRAVCVGEIAKNASHFSVVPFQCFRDILFQFQGGATQKSKSILKSVVVFVPHAITII